MPRQTTAHPTAEQRTLADQALQRLKRRHSGDMYDCMVCYRDNPLYGGPPCPERALIAQHERMLHLLRSEEPTTAELDALAELADELSGDLTGDDVVRVAATLRRALRTAAGQDPPPSQTRTFSGPMSADLEQWLGDAFVSWLPATDQLLITTPTGETRLSAGAVIERLPDGTCRVHRTPPAAE